MIQALQKKLSEQGHIEIMVRARPHAARSQLIDVLEDGSLKIDIAAPADEGKGNGMLMKFLGEMFHVPPSSVKILSGKTARLKLVRVTLLNN